LYLKSLELHGFKSFPEKTVLQFHDGATVIVGPNGSGKSNITDAMRWVLGELSTKNIRGSKMEDVVFAGADGKKPMSFAEVSVTFDDSEEPKVLSAEYDEVTVTRRYYRAGDSEYFINRKKARLRDIYELFMNTGIGREGYSIIGQGKIAEIISKKSEERRSAFEESAGISKYRYRKSESEKKLAETTANMERVADIEGEQAARIGPLEKEAAKAKKYMELYDAKKKVDVALWLYDADACDANIQKSQRDTSISAHELEMAEDSRRQTEDRIDRLYQQSHANKEESQHTHESYSAATGKRAALEGEVQVAKAEIRHKTDQIRTEEGSKDAAAREMTLLEDKQIALSENKKKLDGDVLSAELQGAEAEKTVQKYALDKQNAEKELESLLYSQKEKESALTDLRVRLHVLEQTASTQKQRRQSIQEEIDNYNKQAAEYTVLVDTSNETIAEYTARLTEIQSLAAGEDVTAETLRDAITEAESTLRSKQGKREALQSRIQALQRMQEHFDGYNNSIRFVMTQVQSGRLTGIHGPVSYLIKVAQEYVIAIETALGSALQNIITEDEKAAKAAIAALKQANAGRATFYPVTTIRPMERGKEFDGVEKWAGFIGYADALVECDEKYRNIIRSQLSRTAVFDTLDHATEMARQKNWRIRVVTLDGQIINAGGSFTGGQAKRESGILTRTTEIDALLQDLAGVDKEIAISEKNRTDLLKKEAERIEAEKEREEKVQILAALLRAEESSRGDAQNKKDFVMGLIQNLQQDARAIEENDRRSEEDRISLTAQHKTLETAIADITETREKLAVEKNKWDDALTECQSHWQEIRIALAALYKDRENQLALLDDIAVRLVNMKSSIANRDTQIAVLQREIAEKEALVEEKLGSIAVLDQEIEQLNSQKRVLHETGNALETELAALQNKLKEQTAKKELVYIAHTKNETRLAALQAEYDKMTQRIWDEYELSYGAAQAYLEEASISPITKEERASHVAQQNTLKGQLRSLGHVNISAIEEYVEVKERYDYIKAQMEDLEKAKRELEKILSGIEGEMKTIFLDAFGRINTYFGEVFRELFGGGHAEVLLSDPNEPLTCGIEINAAPPGKNIKNMNLLSGGEQAFIGIALLFALIKVNPSPFCIFDEIEAALDETNVARVGRYVKKYTKEMQIIMISHRRGTMDIADTLYGVTMPQSGVSKVFTLDSAADRDSLVRV